jgi:iron(III) transport system substrate-binding protein
VIPEAELSLEAHLMDPRWKGRISLQDPRGGAGSVNLAAMLEQHGEQFVRDLLTKQDVVVTGDSRQQAEWLVRGRYPISLGVPSAQLLVFRQQGLGQNLKTLAGGALQLTPGVGAIQLLNQAPHPNAARVFINWLLTQSAQERITRTTRLNSLRRDVPPQDPDAAPDPAKAIATARPMPLSPPVMRATLPWSLPLPR